MNDPSVRETLPDQLGDRAATGIEGLDDILGGGLPRNRLYLVQGNPGVGKTTLATQFLSAGVRLGESCLYITLSETAEELRTSAASHGWSLDGITLHHHTSTAKSSEAQHTLFHPDEVDLGETVGALLRVVDEINPRRLVIDSLSELLLLAGDALHYRREVLALKEHFAGLECTVLLLADSTGSAGDQQQQSLYHGVLLLEILTPEYGSDRRRLRVAKLRGLRFRGGFHDFLIDTDGLRVFPRLVAAEHSAEFEPSQVESGLPALDALFGGGPDRGTTTLLVGPSGTGKSSLSVLYAVAAARRGERSALYTFDERLPTLYGRSAGLGLDLASQQQAGMVQVQAIDPAEMSAGEFTSRVRRAVEQDDVRMVVIDSLAGYMHAMPEARALILHLRELLTYLGQRGVTTLIVVVQEGVLPTATASGVDISYLADNVLLFCHYENAGEVRQALAVLKRRGGRHERTIRQFSFGTGGIEVGEPLRDLQGVLTGVPTYTPRGPVPDEA